MNPIKTHFYDQFRRPRGALGHLAGRIMGRRWSNLERSRWTVDLLELAPDARVLELGYGPGAGIEAVLEAAPHGRVVGLDHSRTMQTMATKRCARADGDGRLELLVGDAARPPADIGPFDAIFSCNVWMFWVEQVATLRVLAGLLAPGGRLAVTHLPRHGDAGRSHTEEAAGKIAAQMREVGFDEVAVHYLPLEPAPAVCVIGHGGLIS